MVPERVEREILIEAPPEVVWAVVTEPEHIAGWFSDVAEIDLRPGGKATFTWKEHGAAHWQVEAVEPPHFVSFRWIRGTETEPREGNSTLVEFSLTAEGAGTRLRVVESRFPRLEGPDDDKATYAEEHRQGWKQELDELREYVRQQVRTSAGR
jgi:uncharacterized protein YndB with AHSA1/START domain